MSPTPSCESLAIEDIFQRSLCAHLPPRDFARLQAASVLVAGLGGGSNIAELLVRKGIGRLAIADLDCFEIHNVRQRGSLLSTQQVPKTEVMAERLRDINPGLELMVHEHGVTLENVAALVAQVDYVVDMLDFSALPEKIALNREARKQGKVVVTAPSVVNGAVLYVFHPSGEPDFETFFDYDASRPAPELGLRFLKRLIPHFPEEAPRAMYEAAARGERTLPLDAVGVDQAAVLAVAALENLILGRSARVIFVPLGIQVDLSNPARLVEIVDFSGDFE